MSADDLAIGGARASALMVLLKFSLNIPAPEELLWAVSWLYLPSAYSICTCSVSVFSIAIKIGVLIIQVIQLDI